MKWRRNGRRMETSGRGKTQRERERERSLPQLHLNPKTHAATSLVFIKNKVLINDGGDHCQRCKSSGKKPIEAL